MAAAQARLDCVDSASVGVSRPLRSLCILAFALPSLTGAESSQSVLHLPPPYLRVNPRVLGAARGSEPQLRGRPVEGGELWGRWSVCGCSVYTGHSKQQGACASSPASCVVLCFFSASEKALILFRTHGEWGGSVSAYSKEKPCCHSWGLVDSLWTEHSIPHPSWATSYRPRRSGGEQRGPSVRPASPGCSSVPSGHPWGQLPCHRLFFCAPCRARGFSLSAVPPDPSTSPAGYALSSPFLDEETEVWRR